MGTLGGMAKARGPGAALWIDAHGDLNRPSTSPTGNVHGMPLAAALGAAGPEFESDVYPVPSLTRVALIGSALDPGERDLIRELDVRAFTMSEIDKLGLERVFARGACVSRRCAVPARQPRPRRGRSDVRARRRHTGSRWALLP